MGNRKASAYASEVLADPDGVVHAAVLQIEPELGLADCAAALAEAAPSVAIRRRIAQALFDDSALLTSQSPLGPPALDRLVHALKVRGARRVALPLCGLCHREIRLTSRDGQLRICGSCDVRRRRADQICASCGELCWTRYQDWAGRSYCAACDGKLRKVDQLTRLIGHIQVLSPAADTATVREIALRALPTPSLRRRVADELGDRPLRLTTEAAEASAATLRLLHALQEARIDGFTVPACPFCARTVALTKVLDERRCCRPCYERGRREICSGCANERVVVSRNANGPLCVTCYNSQPENQAVCPGCGEQARLFRLAGQEPRCKRCQRAPTATCSICHRLRPCYFAATPTPRCEACSNKLLRRETCSNCGKFAIVNRRIYGEPLCNFCGRRKATCRDCGLMTRISASLSDGPRCAACYRKHPESFKPCHRCGSLERLHHFGICRRCTCIEYLHTLLDDGAGISPRLEPLFIALARSSPDSTLFYLEYGGGQELLEQLRDTSGPITHNLLDRFRSQPALRPLRDALVCAALLEPRDEILHSLEEQLDEVLTSVVDREQQQLLRSYTTWRLLRKLRAQSTTRAVTRAQATNARRKLNLSLSLLEFAHQKGRQLQDLDQHDIDHWQASTPLAASSREFLSWGIERHHFRRGLVIAPAPRGKRSPGISDDRRWKLARMLLHHNGIDRVDRFAGLLVLLFGQPAGRIVNLRTDAVTQRIADHRTCLALGEEPVELPEPLDQLALDLVINRYRGRAALARVTDHDWLFPGARAGSPMTSHYINGRLKLLGIPARPARNTALMDLASQLPAAVVSSLLGLDIHTAQEWVTEVGERGSYAAELARRPQSAH